MTCEIRLFYNFTLSLWCSHINEMISYEEWRMKWSHIEWRMENIMEWSYMNGLISHMSGEWSDIIWMENGVNSSYEWRMGWTYHMNECRIWWSHMNGVFLYEWNDFIWWMEWSQYYESSDLSYEHTMFIISIT